MPDRLNPRPPNELRLEEEWQQQKAEGRRRMMAFEGIREPDGRDEKGQPFWLDSDGKRSYQIQGTRKGAFLDTATEGFNRDPVITIFAESPADLRDLVRELKDLDRDAALMAQHETVNYFPPSDMEDLDD